MRVPRCARFLLATVGFFLAGEWAVGGTWSFKPWENDDSLPKAAKEDVTHAIAFGVDTEPPAPAPFEITKQIAGENWSLWRQPGHTTDVVVTRRTKQEENWLKNKFEGQGTVLLRGRVVPSGAKGGGLSLEMDGLQPGAKYQLALLGLALLTSAHKEQEVKIKVSGSDMPEHQESLALYARKPRYLVYDYVAPESGTITVFFEADDSMEAKGAIRLCAFSNYRIPDEKTP